MIFDASIDIVFELPELLCETAAIFREGQNKAAIQKSDIKQYRSQHRKDYLSNCFIVYKGNNDNLSQQQL